MDEANKHCFKTIPTTPQARQSYDKSKVLLSPTPSSSEKSVAPPKRIINKIPLDFSKLKQSGLHRTLAHAILSTPDRSLSKNIASATITSSQTPDASAETLSTVTSTPTLTQNEHQLQQQQEKCEHLSATMSLERNQQRNFGSAEQQSLNIKALIKHRLLNKLYTSPVRQMPTMTVTTPGSPTPGFAMPIAKADLPMRSKPPLLLNLVNQLPKHRATCGGGSREQPRRQQESPSPRPAPKSSPKPCTPAATESSTSQTEGSSTPSSRSALLTSPPPLIVLEHKVLAPNEKIDLSALRLPNGQSSSTVSSTKDVKQADKLKLPSRKPTEMAKTILNKVQTTSGTNSTAKKKIILNASKLKMPREQLAQLAKEVRRQAMQTQQQNQSSNTVATRAVPALTPIPVTRKIRLPIQRNESSSAIASNTKKSITTIPTTTDIHASLIAPSVESPDNTKATVTASINSEAHPTSLKHKEKAISSSSEKSSSLPTVKTKPSANELSAVDFIAQLTANSSIDLSMYGELSAEELSMSQKFSPELSIKTDQALPIGKILQMEDMDILHATLNVNGNEPNVLSISPNAIKLQSSVVSNGSANTTSNSVYTKSLSDKPVEVTEPKHEDVNTERKTTLTNSPTVVVTVPPEMVNNNDTVETPTVQVPEPKLSKVETQLTKPVQFRPKKAKINLVQRPRRSVSKTTEIITEKKTEEPAVVSDVITDETIKEPSQETDKISITKESEAGASKDSVEKATEKLVSLIPEKITKNQETVKVCQNVSTSMESRETNNAGSREDITEKATDKLVSIPEQSAEKSKYIGVCENSATTKDSEKTNDAGSNEDSTEKPTQKVVSLISESITEKPETIKVCQNSATTTDSKKTNDAGSNEDSTAKTTEKVVSLIPESITEKPETVKVCRNISSTKENWKNNNAACEDLIAKVTDKLVSMIPKQNAEETETIKVCENSDKTVDIEKTLESDVEFKSNENNTEPVINEETANQNQFLKIKSTKKERDLTQLYHPPKLPKHKQKILNENEINNEVVSKEQPPDAATPSVSLLDILTQEQPPPQGEAQLPFKCNEKSDDDKSNSLEQQSVEAKGIQNLLTHLAAENVVPQSKPVKPVETAKVPRKKLLKTRPVLNAKRSAKVPEPQTDTVATPKPMEALHPRKRALLAESKGNRKQRVLTSSTSDDDGDVFHGFQDEPLVKNKKEKRSKSNETDISDDATPDYDETEDEPLSNNVMRKSKKLKRDPMLENLDNVTTSKQVTTAKPSQECDEIIKKLPDPVKNGPKANTSDIGIQLEESVIENNQEVGEDQEKIASKTKRRKPDNHEQTNTNDISNSSSEILPKKRMSKKTIQMQESELQNKRKRPRLSSAKAKDVETDPESVIIESNSNTPAVNSKTEKVCKTEKPGDVCINEESEPQNKRKRSRRSSLKEKATKNESESIVESKKESPEDADTKSATETPTNPETVVRGRRGRNQKSVPPLDTTTTDTSNFTDSADSATPKEAKKSGRRSSKIQPTVTSTPDPEIQATPKRRGVQAKPMQFLTPGASPSDKISDFDTRLLLIRKREQLESEEELREDGRGKGPHQCGLCLVRCDNFQMHLSEHYGVGWKAAEPQPLLTRSSVMKIMKAYIDAGNKRLTCRLCKRSLTTSLGMLLHLENCGVKERIVCPDCKGSYSKLTYATHSRTCSREPPKPSEQKDEAETTAEDIDLRLLLIRKREQLKSEEELKEDGRGKGALQCGLCLVRCDNWQMHLGEHYGVGWLVGEPQPSLTRSNVMKIMKSYIDSGNKRLTCRLCNRSLTTSLGMLLHLENCGAKERIVCPDCKTSYTKLSYLTHPRTCPARQRQPSVEKEVDETPTDTDENTQLYSNAGRFKRKSTIKAESKLVKIAAQMKKQCDDEPFSSKDNDGNVSDFDVSSDNETSEESGSEGVDSNEDEDNTASMNSSLVKNSRITNKSRISQKTLYGRLNVKTVLKNRWNYFTQKNYAKGVLYPHLMPRYEKFSPDDARKILPCKDSTSMRCAYNKVDNQAWMKLAPLEGFSEKDEYICYMGSPIKELAWIPLPPTVETQYLLCSQRNKMNSFARPSKDKKEDTMFLLLECKISSDKSSNSSLTARLHYGICMRQEAVHSFAFMPSGGYDESTNRLGLLAVGSSPRTVIYALPLHPTEKDSNKTGDDVIVLEPVLTLSLDIENPVRDPCTKISWSESAGHNFLVSGYSSGNVAFWDISDEQGLNCIKRDNQCHFLPANVFYFGERNISHLELHYDTNGPRWLAVGAIVRKLWVYDILNWSQPLPIVGDTIHNLFLGSLCWPPLWDSIAVGVTEVYRHKYPRLLAYNPTGINFDHNAVDSLIGSPRSLHFNAEQITMAAVTDNGDITFIQTNQLNRESQLKKRTTKCRTVCATDACYLNGSSEPDSITPDTFQRDYGLILKPLKDTPHVNTPAYRKSRQQHNFDMLSLMRLNCVRWNWNDCGRNWVAVGAEHGLLRFVHFDRTKHFCLHY